MIKWSLNALCREIEDLHASLNDIRYVATPHDESNPEVIKVIFFDNNISSDCQSHMETQIFIIPVNRILQLFNFKYLFY